MKFKRIFVKKGDCRLWSVIESPDNNSEPKDIFRHLFGLWNNTAYLLNFLRSNEMLLADPFWQGISIDEAIDQVLDEAYDFEMELHNIEHGHPSYKESELSKIFKYFDEGSYILVRNNLSHRKAKPNLKKPMLRIYAAEFDGAYIITGGLIKLTEQLDKTEAEIQKGKINKVLQYLNAERVYTREELDQL